ncbi:LysR family transcriptional regulator [Inquilinus limosus]|uniref:LysR family transcriptional regulator n=1 Tax=Inquilinus limosus TaxID=171674 RepID=UPI003F13AB1E
MRTFLKVCEAGSIAAAARELSLSAPAVSKQLAALETALSVGLLERTTRRMALTPAGLAYRDHALKMLRYLDERESRCLSRMRGEPTGILRVVAARFLAERFLLPHLHEFIERYPGIELDIELAERFPDLEQDRADLIFGMSMAGSAGLVRRSIGRTAYWLAASPDYVRRHDWPQRPDDLCDHRMIAHSMRRTGDMLLFKGGQSVEMRSALRLNDTAAMIEAARAGVGIAALHHYMISDLVTRGELLRLLPEWERPAVSIDLFYRKSGRLLPTLRRFVDFAVEKCRLPALAAPGPS